jgi:hypothetical protein
VEGSLRVPDFVNPLDANDTAWEVNYQRELKPTDSGMSNPARLFVAFASAAHSHESGSKWAEYSLKTQILQDACERSSRLGHPVTPG